MKTKMAIAISTLSVLGAIGLWILTMLDGMNPDLKAWLALPFLWSTLLAPGTLLGLVMAANRERARVAAVVEKELEAIFGPPPTSPPKSEPS